MHEVEQGSRTEEVPTATNNKPNYLSVMNYLFQIGVSGLTVRILASTSRLNTSR